MMTRRVTHGEFMLPVSASDAIGFFTPEGERDWVPGWDPLYPEGEPSEVPGTVFTTAHGHVQIVWVVHHIDRLECSASYSRITAGHHAGTVHIRCIDRPGSRCTVTVEYDMSALPGSDPGVLDAYDDESFSAMMDTWSTDVSLIIGPDNQT